MRTLTSRFDEAFRYAREVHGEHVRKGNHTPYIGHLHGRLVDRARRRRHRGRGDRGAAARRCRGPWRPGAARRHPYALRRLGGEDRRRLHRLVGHAEAAVGGTKRDYVEHAHTLAGPSLRVSAADKVHNTYAILRDLRNTGEQVWARFNAPADDVVAYYESLVRAFRAAGGGHAGRGARTHRQGHPARNGVLK